VQARKWSTGMNVHPSPPTPAGAEDIGAILRAQPPAHSLHQALYNSQAAFDRDMERLFRRHWLLAGHVSMAAAPGDYFLHAFAGESFVILRGNDGTLRAFANVCRHRGSRICAEPQGHAKVLVCPYHAWAYNLDGTLRSARHMPKDFDKSRHGLKPISLEVIQGLVFVSLAEEPLSLAAARQAIDGAHEPYGWANAKVAHRETYEIAANWKLAVENYLECYHCTPSHPEYSRLHALEKPLDEIATLNQAMEARSGMLGLAIPSADHRVGSRTGEASVFTFRYALYDGVKTGGPDGKPVAPLMGRFTDYDGGVTSTHVAPSSFFIAYPDHGVIYRFVPLTASTCAMELIWLVRGDAREGVDYDREQLTWLWRVTSEADKRITEANQQGVNSSFYEPGPYAPVEPNAIHWVAWYLEEIA
jgi:Rieske 2Fe-2S family protein